MDAAEASDVHLWFLKCCPGSFIMFHPSVLLLMNLMTQKSRKREEQRLFLCIITKADTQTEPSLHRVLKNWIYEDDVLFTSTIWENQESAQRLMLK